VKAVNLIPVERRVGAGVGMGRSQGGAYAVIALVGVLALLVFMYGKASHDISSDNSQAAKLTTEAERERSDAGALARYNGLIAASEARTAAAESLVDSRFDWAHALHEVGRVLPTNVSIESMTGAIAATDESSTKASSSASGSGSASSGASSSSATSAAASVTSATPPGSVPTVALTGCAGTQSTVAQMLQRMRLIDGVKEATLTSSVSSAANTSGSTTCPAPSPTFAISVTFEPLPASIPSSTTNVSNTAGGAAATASTGSAK